MSTSIDELLPSISALSHGDKLQLVQLVLAQLAQEGGIEVAKTPSPLPFNPRSFFGIARQPKQAIDDYLTNAHEGWL